MITFLSCLFTGKDSPVIIDLLIFETSIIMVPLVEIQDSSTTRKISLYCSSLVLISFVLLSFAMTSTAVYVCRKRIDTDFTAFQQARALIQRLTIIKVIKSVLVLKNSLVVNGFLAIIQLNVITKKIYAALVLIIIRRFILIILVKSKLFSAIGQNRFVITN